MCVSRFPSLTFEPLLADKADFPMHKITADLFDLESVSYLVPVDRYSGYPWVSRLRSTTTGAICSVLLDIFFEYGFP